MGSCGWPRVLFVVCLTGFVVSDNIGIGAEYCFSGQAHDLKLGGAGVAKYYYSLYCWGSMQSSPDADVCISPSGIVLCY